MRNSRWHHDQGAWPNADFVARDSLPAMATQIEQSLIPSMAMLFHGNEFCQMPMYHQSQHTQTRRSDANVFEKK
jgi:hypothetical protein